MRRRTVAIGVALVLLACSAGLGADWWNQWRGPTRNGLVPGTTPLADSWPAAGPTKVWQSDAIPSGDAGGYGSLAVVDGRVFLYVCWKYKDPIPTRTLADDGLRRLGWIPKYPSGKLADALDTARQSEELAKLRGKDAREWVAKWVETNLSADEKKQFGEFATQRLNQGKNAAALTAINTLLGAIEQARQSEELAKLKDKEASAWVAKWVGANVTAQLKQFSGYATQRLTEGKDALPLSALEKLLPAMEQARQSPELAKLMPQDPRPWVAKWVEANMSADEKTQFGGFVTQWLSQGTDAVPLSAINKLLGAIEQARQSEELAKLKGKDARDWAAKWVKDNVTAEFKQFTQQFTQYAAQRLNEGKNAVPLDGLDKLAGIKGKEFATQAELEKWLGENGIEGEMQKRVVAQFPTTKDMAHDSMLCLSATDGKPAWKIELPGFPHPNGASCTPCVVGDRCYIIGSESDVYCLDVKDGSKLWTGKAGKGPKHCSFVVVDGAAIVPSGPMMAFDAEKGTVLWTQAKIGALNSSPVVWQKDGKSYVLCNDEQKVSCVEAKTGNIVWTAPGGGWCTPAVVDDDMAVFSAHKGVGVTLYRLSAAKAEKLWTVDAMVDRGASPLIAGKYVYAVGNQGVVCAEREGGKLVWHKKLGGLSEISSPVFVDGKVLAQGGNALLLLKPTPEDCTVAAQAKIGMAACNSPAMVDGKLYVRLANGVACYDLVKKAEEKPPEKAPDKPAAEKPAGEKPAAEKPAA